MRIMFLNTWHGKMEDALRDFIGTYAKDTDVFCLQEAEDVVEAIGTTTLPEYRMVTAQKPNHPFPYRQATFFRDTITLRYSAPVLLDLDGGGLGLYTEFVRGDKTLHLINYHGAAFPGDKLDDTSRIESSRGLIDFLATKNGHKVIGGDFNLAPETQSVQVFERAGYTNQIKKNGIATTRNHLAWDKHPNKQYYADYAFTSPEVKVAHFEVIENEVSDHLPLVLDIEI